MRIHLILVVLISLVLGGCSESQRLPGQPDDTDQITFKGTQGDAGAAVKKKATTSTLKSMRVKIHNRGIRTSQEGTAFGRSIKIVYSNGYVVDIKNTAVRNALPNGFIYRPGIGPVSGGLGTSHGGMYVLANKGNNSTYATIYWR